MTIGQGPTSSRRRLRTTLRKFRERRGFSLDDVRKAMEWSLSKIIRIESGAVSVSANDLKGLLDFYQISDPQVAEGLLQLARVSRQRHWSNAYRDHVSQTYQDFLGYEDDAQRIRQYHPVVIPGLLQTEDYARTLITAMRRPSDDEIDARVRMRMERQRRVFDRPDMAHLHVVIDALVFRRPTGGRGVMRAQLDRLLQLQENPRIKLIIIPEEVEAHLGYLGGFSILEFAAEDDPDVVYLENAPNDVGLVEGVKDVDIFKVDFEKMVDLGIEEDRVVEQLQLMRDRL